MNHPPETAKKPEGLLEIVMKENPDVKVAQINVFKSEDNYWIYLRNNGNPLKRTYMDPERMVASLPIAYLTKKGMKVTATYTKYKEEALTE